MILFMNEVQAWTYACERVSASAAARVRERKSLGLPLVKGISEVLRWKSRCGTTVPLISISVCITILQLFLRSYHMPERNDRYLYEGTNTAP